MRGSSVDTNVGFNCGAPLLGSSVVLQCGASALTWGSNAELHAAGIHWEAGSTVGSSVDSTRDTAVDLTAPRCPSETVSHAPQYRVKAWGERCARLSKIDSNVDSTVPRCPSEPVPNAPQYRVEAWRKLRVL